MVIVERWPLVEVRLLLSRQRFFEGRFKLQLFKNDHESKRDKFLFIRKYGLFSCTYVAALILENMFFVCNAYLMRSATLFFRLPDPWTRRLSLGSRRSFDVEPTTPTTDQTVVKVTSNPSFSYHDSGIVPDGGSIGYNQGGLINSAYEKEPWKTESFYRTTVGGVQERPRLHKKRISFKDEVEANEAALPSPKEEEDAGSKVRLSAGKTTPKQETSDLPSSDKYGCYTQENGYENKIIVSPEMDAAFEDESSCGDTRSSSSKRKRKIAVLGMIL